MLSKGMHTKDMHTQETSNKKVSGKDMYSKKMYGYGKNTCTQAASAASGGRYRVH